MQVYRSLLLTLSLILALAAAAHPQTSTVHTTGLFAPNKIIKAPANSLIVAEAGTTMPNNGRLSIVDRTSGMRHTLISGLPSGVSFLGGPMGDPSGPSGILLRGNTLFLTTGSGNAVMPGPGPGLELPNPNPSSPLFNSIFEITLPGGFTGLDSPFVMTMDDQEDLDDGEIVTLTNAEGFSLTIRLVADLPDWRPNPRPMNPDNVKASNLYGIELFQKSLYVADASQNEITEVGRYSGEASALAVFPSIPNPGMGPPFIEVVPDNIHRFGNRLLVPLLTGFPFLPGISTVQAVDIRTGEFETLISGLTHAIDIAKVGDDDDDLVPEKTEKGSDEGRLAPTGKLLESKGQLFAADDSDGSFAPGDGNAYYTLEFSLNFLMGGMGRLRFYQSPNSTPVNLLTDLITPTSMTLDSDTGNLFITNIGPGTVTKVTFP